MNRHDGELDRLLRDSRPAHARSDELPPVAEAHLQALLGRQSTADATRRGPSRGHRRLWAGVAAAAVLVMIAGTVSVISLAPGPSYAVTPPLPQYAHVDSAAAPLLEGLAARALRQPPAPSTAMQIEYESWVLSTQTDADGAASAPYVQPQDATVVHSDAGATVTVHFGSAYDATGEPVPEGAPPAGGVLSEYTLDIPVAAPPVTVAGWPGYLTDTFGIPADAPAGEVLLQLPSILDFWELTPTQNAALLEYLSTLPDLSVAGSSSDRLGRTGIAFDSGPVGDDWQPVLLVDPDTGRVLSLQTLYVGADRTDIPSPSVIEYTTWK